MKWAFATALVIVAGAVGAFAIYTFGWREDSAESPPVVTHTALSDPKIAQVRSVWRDFHAWECPASAEVMEKDLGPNYDNSSCEGQSIISIVPIRRNLYRLRIHNPDDSAGKDYDDTCYAVNPDKYEPPPLTAEWPYEPPGLRLLENCPA